MTEEGALVGVKDVAQHLKCSRNYVYMLVTEQGLPNYRLGNRLRFKLTEVDAWLEHRQKEET